MKNGNKYLLVLLIVLIALGIVFFIWKEEETTQDTSNDTNFNINTRNQITNSENQLNNTSKNTNLLLLDVMNNKQKFIDENNNEILLKDLEIVESQKAEVSKYAFVDLDKDGTQELVIYTTSDYGAYVILHYSEEKVYGYMIGIRSLENLKADGSFTGSNGVNSTQYLRMTFDKNTYNVNIEAVYDINNNIYKINNNNVSLEDIKEYVENWNKKANIEWNEED